MPKAKGLKSGIFDPEGSGYDYASARRYGISPDATGHWQSREPKTGLILKGMRHKTIQLSRDADTKAGYNWVKRNGRYYSLKK
jgi:hypothetical protein